MHRKELAMTFSDRQRRSTLVGLALVILYLGMCVFAREYLGPVATWVIIAGGSLCVIAFIRTRHNHGKLALRHVQGVSILCQDCGYDLIGLQSQPTAAGSQLQRPQPLRCPECGVIFDPALADKTWQKVLERGPKAWPIKDKRQNKPG
jgi:DNA-directed RNA polymerase subunit RPC12/RpoP